MSPLAAAVFAASAASPDIHSFGNAAVVRPTHLALDLALDFDRKTLRGTCELTLAYAGDGSEANVLDLDSRGLLVEAVSAGGQPLAFERGPADPILGERLRITLPSPRPGKVKVAYATAPGATALQWLEPRQTTSGKLPFLFTQSQALHARSWIPTMDSPGVRQTFEAVIRVPAGRGFTVVMGAENLAHEPERGLFRFRMPQPVPPYLMALAAGEIAFQAIGPRTGVYAEPAVLPKAAKEFEDVEKMVEATEAIYGAYDWGRWDTIVLPPSFPFGGMENPRLTFATPTILAGDKSLVALLAHELAHSWSGNLVTNATWSDFWLNEGFTSYIEGRIVEALYGPEFAQMELSLALRELGSTVEEMLKEDPAGTVLYANLEGKDPDDLVGPIAYDKGASFLRMLEARFGRQRFDAFLKGYFQSHRFGNMTTARFLEILKRDLFAGDEAAWADAKVQEWVFAPGLPSNLVPARSQRFERTRAAAEAFAKDGSLDLVKRDWSSPEWQDFVESLPRPMTPAQMQALDDAFAFSKAGNNEVRFDWLMHVARNAWEPGYASLEQFLTSLGRRKFLTPIYAALMEKESTAPLARAIYAKARPTYHPIAVGTLDAVVK
jgi:leukotriene-A4 hydrolase